MSAPRFVPRSRQKTPLMAPAIKSRWDAKDDSLMKIMERNAHESPLLRLPAEIRDQIYRLVLGGNTWDIRSDRQDIRSDGQLIRSNRRDIRRSKGCRINKIDANTFSLPKTCHQIYLETFQFPIWKMNTLKASNIANAAYFMSRHAYYNSHDISSMILSGPLEVKYSTSNFVLEQGELRPLEIGVNGCQAFPNLKDITVFADVRFEGKEARELAEAMSDDAFMHRIQQDVPSQIEKFKAKYSGKLECHITFQFAAGKRLWVIKDE